MTPVKKILSFVERLRFPWLVLLAGLLFVANLLIPDPIPLVDELLMGLVMLALGRIRKPRSTIESSGNRSANKS